MKKYFWATLGLIIGVTLLRLFIIGNLGLGDDEAYYWDWSRYLSLSYFDHPPLIAFLIALFVRIGKSSEFFVRLGGVILFFLSNLVLFQISRKLFDEKVGFFSVILLNLIPVFALGAVIAAPDGPLGFFFIFSIFIFIKAIESDKKLYWYLWGLLLGFCLLSKYNGAILICSYLLYFLFSKDRAKFLKNPHIYLALLIAALMFSPVIIWNYHNHWASFRFQFLSGHQGHFSLDNLLLFLGSQAGYLSLLLYPFLIIALYIAGYRGLKGKDERYLLIFSLSAPTLILFHLASPRLSFKPHWTALGYLPMLIVAVQLAKEQWGQLRVRILSIVALTLAFAFTAFIHVQAFYPILPGNILPPKLDITNELYGWKEVGERAGNLEREMKIESGKDSDFIFSYRYQLVSQLAFYTPGQPEVYSLNNWLDAYDFLQNGQNLLEKDGIFVCDNRFDRKPDELYNFDSFHRENDLVIYRAGREARRFYIFRCYNFRGIKK
jgi:4-amino-4-deoxy-L-arabinose transferase-like glycosyltransferase